jgi:hypothetical protein
MNEYHSTGSGDYGTYGGGLSARINSLESRIDMMMWELTEIDTGLSRVEARLEHG